MTSPESHSSGTEGIAGPGKLIARGYVRVDLSDGTRDDLAALLARLRAVGPVEIPVTLDYDEIDKELGSRKAQPMSVKLNRGEIATQLKGWDPVTLPVKVNRVELNKQLATLTPLTLPVKVQKKQLTEELGKLTPVALPVTVNRKQLTAQLAGLPPVVLPVKVDRAQLQKQLEDLDPVTVPVRFDREQLETQMAALGAVKMPVRVERAQLQRELNGMNPPSMAVQLHRLELQTQLRSWTPLVLPTKVQRTDAQSSINEWKTPVTLPVKINRAQMQRELKQLDSVLINVKFSRAQIQRELKAIEPPVVLPITVDRNKLRRYLETMTPVTIPVRWGTPLNRPGGDPGWGTGPSGATPPTPTGGATGAAGSNGSTGSSPGPLPFPVGGGASTGRGVNVPPPQMAGSGRTTRPDLDALKAAQESLTAATQRYTTALAAQQLAQKRAGQSASTLAKVTVDGFVSQARMAHYTRESTKASKAYDAATSQLTKQKALQAHAELLVKQASEEVQRVEQQRISESPRALAAMDRTVAAREREASAIGRVRAAEAALVEEQNKESTTAAKLTRAEERLASAKRAHEASSRNVTSAMRNEQAAVKEAIDGVTRLGTAWQRMRGNGKAYLPWDAKLLESTGPQFDQMRDRLFELQRAARIRPTYEARIVYDEMGRAQVRYFKVSADQGSFMGEVMSKNMLKSFVTGMKFPAVLGPVGLGLVAGISSAAILAVPAAFAKIALAAQRQIPLVNSAFLQLNRDINDALRIDTAPLTTTLLHATRVVGTGFQALRPAMRESFEALPPMIDRAATGVVGFARNAMPGLVTAVKVAGPVVDGFFDGLETAGQGVTRFFTQISVAAPQAGQTFRTFGVVASEVGDLLGRLGASVTQVFGGQLWNEVETIFTQLSSIVGDFAQGALPMLGLGLEIAGNALTVVLGVLEPFAGLMGTWVGTALGAALAVRGLSSALGVLAAAGGLLKFTPLTGAVQKLGIQAGTAGTALAGMTTRLTGTARAGELVATGTSKVVGALGKVGSAVPYLGVALVGLAIGYDELRSKSDEAADSVLNGSKTFQQAVNDERNQIEKRNALLGVFAKSSKDLSDASVMEAEARSNVTVEMAKQYAAMAPLERAQAAVNEAQGRYNDSLRDFGATHPATIAALNNLGTAKANLTAAESANAAAMNESERSARSLTQALIDQSNEMNARLNAGFAYRQAIEQLGEATKKAAEAEKAHGRGSKEHTAAVTEQVKAINDAANAQARRWDAQNAHLSDDERAAGAAREYNRAIMELLPPGKGAVDVLNNMSKELTNSDLAMLSTEARATGLKTELVKLNDGREVEIVVDDKGLITARERAEALTDYEILIPVNATVAQAETAVNTFGELVSRTTPHIKVGATTMGAWEAYETVSKAITEGKKEITIDGKTMPVDAALEMVLAQIRQANPEVMINGRTVPFDEALKEILARATSSTGMVNLDAKTQLADGKTQATLKMMDGSTGTLTLAANGAPAEFVLNGTKYKVDQTTGVMTIDGNPAPGQEDLSGLKLSVDRTTGQLTILGRDGGVAALKAILSRPSSSWHTIYVTQSIKNSVSGALAAAKRASGGGAGGGVVGFSGGGVTPAGFPSTVRRFGKGGVIPGYAPGIDDVPSMLSRGESVLVPELTRLLGPANIIAANKMASGRASTQWSPTGEHRKSIGTGNGRAEEVQRRMGLMLGQSQYAGKSSRTTLAAASSEHFNSNVAGRARSVQDQVAAVIRDAETRVAAAAQAQASGGGNGSVVIQGGVTVRLDGTWDFSNSSFPRQFVLQLEEALRDLGRSRK
jgi:hypothetical protein